MKTPTLLASLLAAPLLAAALLALASPTMAQSTAPAAPPQASPPPPASTLGGPNNTGGEPNLTAPRGATGAGTVQTDSAAGGNAAQPSRAVPQGSGGGSSGGNP